MAIEETISTGSGNILSPIEKAEIIQLIEEYGGGDILNKVYPVGSIYMSVNNVSPQTFLGGLWVEWGAGRVPVGMGDNGATNYTTVEETGGEDQHQLTDGELPKLDGSFTLHGAEGASLIYSATGIMAGYNFHNGDYRTQSDLSRHLGANSVGSVSISFGNNQPHENRQPYITCYMWKRIA